MDDLTEFDDRLRALNELPFVETVEVHHEPGCGTPEADAEVLLATPNGTVRLLAEIKRTHLTHAIVDAFLARALAGPDRDWILLAPYVPPGIAERLIESGVNFLDGCGNYRIRVDDRYFAERTGRKPARKPAALRGMRLAGYQVLFTLLARPEYLHLTVRELAAKAGVGKTAAADTVNRLAAEGLVGTGKHPVMLERRELYDRWLAGYATHVRPRIFRAAYRTPHRDPLELEADLEETAPSELPWAFGGGAAAYRLTGYYRGPTTVVHVDGDPRRLLGGIKALRDNERGPLVVLGVPGPTALEGVEPRTAHPLLIYTELYSETHDHPREAAAEVAERYLEGLI